MWPVEGTINLTPAAWLPVVMRMRKGSDLLPAVWLQGHLQQEDYLLLGINDQMNRDVGLEPVVPTDSRHQRLLTEYQYTVWLSMNEVRTEVGRLCLQVEPPRQVVLAPSSMVEEKELRNNSMM